MTKPDIYEYIDFREFLKDLFEYNKSKDSSFTKSYICKMVGLPNTRSFFNDILGGKPLSQDKTTSICNVFFLKKAESSYFRLLVNYNQSSDAQEKEFYFSQLLSYKKIHQDTIHEGMYEYYKEWYYSIVRALFNVIDFNGNYKKLAEKIHIPLSIRQLKDAVQVLNGLNLIKKDPKGHYRPSSRFITTGSKIENEIIKQYQMKAFDVLKDLAIRNECVNKRILTKVVGVSFNGYERIIEKLELFNKEIDSIISEDIEKEERLYQCCVSIIEVTRGENE